MTEAEALERLESMVAYDAEPALTEAQLDDLLLMSKREDTEGRAPTHEEWEPTFDLDAAAAEGWRWKAGKAVPRFGVSIDGDTLHRQHIYLHCLRQAEHYAKKIVGTLGVKSGIPIPTEADWQVEA